MLLQCAIRLNSRIIWRMRIIMHAVCIRPLVFRGLGMRLASNIDYSRQQYELSNHFLVYRAKPSFLITIHF